MLDAATDHVQLALEGVLVGDVVAGAHEQLRDPRGHGPRRRATRALVHRNLPPTQDELPLGLDAVLQESHRLGWVTGWHEANGDPVAPRLGQLEVDLGAQEGVRELDEDARAVPGIGVGALRSAMLEALERVQRPGHDLVRRGRAQPRHECDAAGVVLVARVVQAT